MRFIEILFNEYIEILCFCYFIKRNKIFDFFIFIHFKNLNLFLKKANYHIVKNDF